MSNLRTFSPEYVDTVLGGLRHMLDYVENEYQVRQESTRTTEGTDREGNGAEVPETIIGDKDN